MSDVLMQIGIAAWALLIAAIVVARYGPRLLTRLGWHDLAKWARRLAVWVRTYSVLGEPANPSADMHGRSPDRRGAPPR